MCVPATQEAGAGLKASNPWDMISYCYKKPFSCRPKYQEPLEWPVKTAISAPLFPLGGPRVAPVEG
eukprot:5072754-Amphidinium_carterae.1